MARSLAPKALVSALAAAALTAALVVLPWADVAAAPEKGTIIIRTVSVQTGQPIGGIRVTVEQATGDFPEDPVSMRTDVAGRLFVAVFPGTYVVDSNRSADPEKLVSVASRSEVPVLIPIRGR